jgi:hypothetical protein
MTTMALQATQLADLVATTQKNLGKPNFTEIATDLQKHTAMSNLLKKNRIVLTSGYGIQWDVMVNHSGSAANVGLGASDNVTIVDTMVQAAADWRNTTANYAIIGQEIDMNREPARIVDLVRERRIACMISMAELMESNFWGPPVASGDSTTPWGVNTWIVKNASEGFNGGAPSGYTSIGLNPTTYPRWKNWTAQYTAVAKDDLIRKLRKAATFTNFMPPVENIPTFNTGNNWAYYSNYSVIGAMEEILESQNENLGPDVASMDGKVIFRRSPLEWVPKLEADSTNPVYGINWGELKTYVLSGWWMKETNVPIYPGQHTVSAHFMDCTYQIITKNRRCHFVVATGTTYPG